MDLLECRNKLDELDRQIVELFEQRMEICGQVAQTKIASGKAVYDGERERQKLAAVSAMAHGSFNQIAVQELFSQMMTISRRYQYRLMAEYEAETGEAGQQTSGGAEPGEAGQQTSGRAEPGEAGQQTSGGAEPGAGASVSPSEAGMGFTCQGHLPKTGVRVVYQGVEGAYSHGAALQYFGSDAQVYHVERFGDAMEEVQSGRADYAVLPIENSSAGAVVDMYDLLSRYSNYIVAETFLPVSHALLGLKDAELSDIQTVYSHSQALMQSSQFLGSRREWTQVSMENTAVAARKVLEDQDKTQAAVASETAGKLYGLKVLKPSIQNNQGNTTRFVILSRKAVYSQDAAKVSLCFELPHKSGALYNILGNFIFNHVNMLMIQSRPIPARNWEYRFFVDIEGNLEDAAVKNALRGIREEALNMRILGNY